MVQRLKLLPPDPVYMLANQLEGIIAPLVGGKNNAKVDPGSLYARAAVLLNRDTVIVTYLEDPEEALVVTR